MRINIIVIIFLFPMVFSIGCSKEKIAYTTVQTGEVAAPDDKSVIFTAMVTNTTDSITEYGFKWNLDYSGAIQRSYSYSHKGRPEGNYFEEKISSSMSAGSLYFVRAFVKTTKGISYGKYVQFRGGKNEMLSILDIKPDSVLLYDTIMIIGKNLGYGKDDPVVTASSVNLPVLRDTPDTIFARIPLSYKLASSLVYVHIFFDSFDTSDKPIFLKPFTINSLTPETAKPNTFITLNVKNFRPYFNPVVYLSGPGTTMQVSGMTNNSITCKVPNQLGSYYIDVYIGGNLTRSPAKLTIVP